jgi:uncharacterized protein (TIGR03000 family)
MRRLLLLFASCLFFTSSTRGDEPRNPDGVPYSQLGGFQFFRQGNQSGVTVGGGLFPRKVRLATATPEGLVVTRFTLPSSFQAAQAIPVPQSAPANIRVEIPDTVGVLFLGDDYLACRGTLRYLQSPMLAPGQSYSVSLRAGWMVGDRILIEERQIELRAGETTAVTFDGSRAMNVPVPVREKK